jgi:DeoR/GlpR family transcriptional regulator of sugar metabolism
MLPEQRRRQILEQVESGQMTSIVDLSQKYDVSEMTIRRDLKLLEEEGQIRRTHGGALPVNAPAVEPRYAAKQKINAHNKTAIARYAAEHMVSEGDIIILEGGTTITRMAQFLTIRDNLTVVTNGLYTTNELRHLLPHVAVICTGGILRDVSFTFVGPLVEQFFRELHASTVFVSATGLTPEAGLTDPNMLEVQVKKAMIAAARRVIVLLDSSKFGVQSLSTILRPEDADLLITDDQAPRAIVDALRARGIEICQVPAAAPPH